MRYAVSIQRRKFDHGVQVPSHQIKMETYHPAKLAGQLRYAVLVSPFLREVKG